jgi:hypothetical protein
MKKYVSLAVFALLASSGIAVAQGFGGGRGDVTIEEDDDRGGRGGRGGRAVTALRSASPVRIVADVTGTEAGTRDGKPSSFAPCRPSTASSRSAVAAAASSSPGGSAPTAPS